MARSHKQDKPITVPIVNLASAYLNMLESRRERNLLIAELRAEAASDAKAFGITDEKKIEASFQRRCESKNHKAALDLAAKNRRTAEYAVISSLTHALWKASDAQLLAVMRTLRNVFPEAEVRDPKYDKLIAEVFGTATAKENTSTEVKTSGSK